MGISPRLTILMRLEPGRGATCSSASCSVATIRYGGTTPQACIQIGRRVRAHVRRRGRPPADWASVRNLLGVALAAFVLAACSADGSGAEAEVAAHYRNFPSGSQPPGTRAWPEGRFTGECRAARSGLESYACLYADKRGRRGFVCFTSLSDLEINTAVGPFDSREWTGHNGLPLPPEGVC
jgi:hypothetical protein